MFGRETHKGSCNTAKRSTGIVGRAAPAGGGGIVGVVSGVGVGVRVGVVVGGRGRTVGA